MTNGGTLKIKISKNAVILKDINESVCLDRNWFSYCKTIRCVQKTTNEFLTELVKQEKLADEHVNAEDEDDDEDASDEGDNESEIVKRKHENSENTNSPKKNKVSS